MLFTIVIGVLVIFLLWYFNLKYKYKSVSIFPGPKSLFFLGSALELGMNPVDVLKNTVNFMKKYGKFVHYWIGPNRPYLWTADVKFLEFLLTSTKNINKTSDYSFLHSWLGTGLLVSGGNKWRKRRKIITPAFNLKILEEFIEVFNNCGDILIEKLSKNVNEAIDIYPYITLCALDAICESTMGTSIKAQENSNSKYVKAVQNCCNILIERTISSWKQFDFLFQFSNSYKVQKESLKILHNFTNSVIEQRRIALQSNNKNDTKDQDNCGIKKRMAFLDLLIQTTYDNGQPLSDNDIREEVDTFMFAGHDTTASAISFTLYLISKHADIQNKIIEELNEIFAENKMKSINFNQLNEMKYLELVIKESLRLYPPVPFYAREIQEDTFYDNILLPKGLLVVMYPFVLHRDPILYPDPEKFIPERFLPECLREKSPYSYLPFSAGLRNCIGQKFAMLEMKTCISKILYNFELIPVSNHELLLSAEVVLKSANGVCIMLQKRGI